MVAKSSEIGTTPSTMSMLDQQLAHVRGVERRGEVAPVRVAGQSRPDG